MSEVIQWFNDNGGAIFALTTTIIAIWGSQKSVALKVLESVAETNDARNKLALKGATKKLNEAADDAIEFIDRAHNDFDYGTALLWRRSSDPKKRARAERMLAELDKPTYLGKGE
jgi:cellobiose-specific phosphotransferase system component IIA